MKLKRRLTVITLAAMLSFVGVGFAAWTFTGVQNVQEVSSITDKVAVGIELNSGFKLYNASGDAEVSSLYLICDAPTTPVAGKYLAGSGIYWATDAAGANPITNVYIKGSLTKDMEDSVKDKTTATISFTGSKTDFAASAYVSFGDMTISDLVLSDIVAGNRNVQSANFALPAVAYTTIPESISELTAMNTALGTTLASAKLTFTAQITA